MNFADLTWNPDNWNEDQQLNLGFQAQYEAENGWSICVNTQLPEDGSQLASATAPDQLYRCTVWSWDRQEGDTEPHSSEDDCSSARVQELLTELATLAGEVTTTTTAAPGPAGQWD